MWLFEKPKYNPETGQCLTNGTWEYKPPLAQDINSIDPQYNINIYEAEITPKRLLEIKTFEITIPGEVKNTEERLKQLEYSIKRHNNNKISYEEEALREKRTRRENAKIYKTSIISELANLEPINKQPKEIKNDRRKNKLSQSLSKKVYRSANQDDQVHIEDYDDKDIKNDKSKVINDLKLFQKNHILKLRLYETKEKKKVQGSDKSKIIKYSLSTIIAFLISIVTIIKSTA